MITSNTMQQIGSFVLNRTEPSHQVKANIAGLKFSEVLGASSKDSPPKVDEVVEKKLTGMLLGNVMQIMLPKETEGLFGERRFADMWSSFFADALAEGMNASGKFDLRLSNR